MGERRGGEREGGQGIEGQGRILNLFDLEDIMKQKLHICRDMYISYLKQENIHTYIYV